LTGGGSGGHITPLLSLAHELKLLSPSCQITYIGHKGDRFDSLKESSKDFDFVSFINSGKFRRYHGESFVSHLLDVKTLLLNVRDFFRVISATFRAIKILRKVKPDVVFSKGGFVVVPVGIAAKLLRIPIVTHDSDTTPGLANRIIGRWAVVNATGMPAKYYSYNQSKIKHVGIPVAAGLKPLNAAEISKLKTHLGLGPNSQVLLATGGGNGSLKINNLVVAIAPHLLKSNLALHIIHLTGSQHLGAVSEDYKQLLPQEELKRVKTFSFTSDFDDYAAAADLILSRAGATSLAEYATLAKATVVIPSPFLAGGHQLKNAEFLEQNKAAVILDEEVSSDELLVVLSELLNNQKRRQQLAQNMHKLAKPNAAKDLALIIIKAANRNSGD